jgi:hypothetical protein
MGIFSEIFNNMFSTGSVKQFTALKNQIISALMKYLCNGIKKWSVPLKGLKITQKIKCGSNVVRLPFSCDKIFRDKISHKAKIKLS